jgi:hypothetical protein
MSRGALVTWKEQCGAVHGEMDVLLAAGRPETAEERADFIRINEVMMADDLHLTIGDITVTIVVLRQVFATTYVRPLFCSSSI